MKVIIKGELTDLNTYIDAERTNRFMGAKIKQEQTGLVAYSLLRQRFENTDGTILHCNWYVKDLKKDADNIVFAKKFILDGLVQAHLLEGDGRKYITGFIDMVFVDKKNPRIEMELV